MRNATRAAVSASAGACEGCEALLESVDVVPVAGALASVVALISPEGGTLGASAAGALLAAGAAEAGAAATGTGADAIALGVGAAPAGGADAAPPPQAVTVAASPRFITPKTVRIRLPQRLPQLRLDPSFTNLFIVLPSQWGND